MFRTTRWMLLCAILATAIGLRLWRITSLPPGFSFAEAYEGLEAWHILNNPHYHPVFLSHNNGVPPLNAYLNAFTFAMFRHWGGEPGPVAMRVTAAGLGVFGVLALYLLAHELHKLEQPNSSLSPAYPCFAAAVLAVMRWHIHFSRIGIEAIFVPLVWTLVVWLLLRGWRTGWWVDFAGSGIGLGVGMYTYQAAWLIPFLLPLLIALLFLQRPKLSEPVERVRKLRSQQYFGLLILGVAALSVVLPLAWYAWRHLDMLILRLNQVKIGGNLERNVAPPSLWHNLWVTANIYNIFGHFGDRDIARNIHQMPVLNVWLAAPFYVGLGIAAYRGRRPSYALVLISLVGLLLPGTLSQTPLNFRRLLGAAAPTALVCGIALDWLWQGRINLRPLFAAPTGQSTTNHWTLVSGQLRWISILLLILGGATSAQEYFVLWAAQPGLYAKFNTGLWEIGQQILVQPPDTPLYATPYARDHPTLAFQLETHHRAAPLVFDGNHIFPLQRQSTPQSALYLVMEPEDRRTRLLLPQIFPTATLQKELREGSDAAVTRLYLRPAYTTPQRPPQHPLAVRLGDGIALQGYDVQPARLRAGHILYLQLHWVVQDAPACDWTVFTHLLTKDRLGAKRLIVGYDSRPGAASLPTRQWQKGWRILDEYQIKLPATVKPGQYELAIGLYQLNGQHLPLTHDGVTLGEVNIE